MAPAKKCPVCGQIMWTKQESYRAKGTYVVYQCRNIKCHDYVKTYGRNPYEESVFIDDEKNKWY